MEITLSNGKDHVYQWDKDIIVTVPENVPVVHFAWGNQAVKFEVKNRQVTIPPELMQVSRPIRLWTYEQDHTIDDADIKVYPKPKPADYAYTPTEIRTWEQLDERITELEAANVQPNWDQNDASAADYVRGRTHYVGAKHDVRIINQHSGEFTPELGLIIGNTYLVSYNSGAGFNDGEEFVCKDFNDGKDGIESDPYVGKVNGSGGPDPYLIFNDSIELHAGFSHVASIAGWKIEGDFADIKTLDTKYLDPGLLERIEKLEDGGGVAGVTSINGKTGVVELAAEDVGAATPEDVSSAVEEAWTEAQKTLQPMFDAKQPKGDYITQDGLQSATDAALEQAKASGAFDGPQGPKGDTGDTGPQGPAGADGAGMDITGATVGQTVKIAAVDENGAPTAWLPTDMPSGGGGGSPTVHVDMTTDEELAWIYLEGFNTYSINVLVYFVAPSDASNLYVYPMSDNNVNNIFYVWSGPSGVSSSAGYMFRVRSIKDGFLRCDYSKSGWGGDVATNSAMSAITSGRVGTYWVHAPITKLKICLNFGSVNLPAGTRVIVWED